MHQFLLRPAHLVIIRHAESVRNAGKAGVFYTEEERSNIGPVVNQHITLTEQGHLQAVTAGKLLAKKFKRFDMIFHSGYQRTIETMNGIISGYSEVTTHRTDTVAQPLIFQDIAIRERDAGYAYHMTEKEVHEYFPWNQSVWDLKDPFFTRPVGGESMADVVARLDTFFTRLSLICEGQNVLLVSHGRAINAMRFLLEGMNVAEMDTLPPDPENASYIAYKFDTTKQVLVRNHQAEQLVTR